MKFKGKVKGDFILVVVLILIGIGGLIYNQVIVPRRGQGTKVLVEIEGAVVRELELSQDTAPILFETEYGFNVVEITNGQVRVSEADCPDLLCVHTGWRQHAGQVIACLPHYFVVRIVGSNGTSGELDGFTY